MLLICEMKKTILAFILAGLILGTAISINFLSEEKISPGMGEMKFRVAVDPGHGSIDTGASYGSIHEKDINLEVGKKLAEELKEVNIEPIMTRTRDILYRNNRSQDIKYRPRVVEDNGADVLISIHVNNFSAEQPSGSQVFHKPGSEKSRALAKKIDNRLSAMRIENDRAVMPGSYYVLNEVSCPAILVEIGFLSNPEDRKLMVDSEYQQELAEAITGGTVEFLSQELSISGKEKKVNTSAVDGENKIYYVYIAGKELKLKSEDLSVDAGNFFRGKYEGMEYREIMVRRALERLHSPPEEYQQIIPESDTPPKIQISGSRLKLDFPQEIIDAFPGGSRNEELLLKSLTGTLLSIRGIEEVQILINGEKARTIGGHKVIDDVYRQN